MEYKIGEIFEEDKKWYQCVVGSGCSDCYLNNSSKCVKLCTANERSDKTSIIFKELEKVGEPYEYFVHNRGVVMLQPYKLFTTPIINGVVCNVHYDSYTIDLEIKQSKREDMEEKKQCSDNRFRAIARAKEYLLQSTNIAEDKKELEVLDSFLLRCWQMGWLKKYEDAEEKKLNLKPFDLQKAREGKPVCTRDGRRARIICWDRDWDMHIVALVSDHLGESVHSYLSNGKVDFDKQNDEDLMMLPEKKEGWVNVYREESNNNERLIEQTIYKTRKDAFEHACPQGYITTTKINWEE